MGIPFKDRVNFCKSCEQYKDCVQPYNEECGVLHSIIDNILSEDAERRREEEYVQRSDGVLMKCYRKISVCCKAATCELGIMCQVGEKIEAECKVCEGQGECRMAFKEDALACDKIQKVLSDKEDKKVVQFPVDMDEMQRNILVELLNARKECTDQNILTARGCVAIIDALFYLVKEKPVWMGIDIGDPNGDRTGGLD